MGPRPNLSFCACKPSWLAPKLQVSMGPRHHLSLCACKTGYLASELLVSMGPSPHLWFLHAKERLLEQNYKSLWVPDLTCRLVHQTILISTRITTLCGSYTSPVVFACKRAWLAWELLVSMGPGTYLWFLHAKQRPLDQNYKSLWVTDLTCRFVHAKQGA